MLKKKNLNQKKNLLKIPKIYIQPLSLATKTLQVIQDEFHVDYDVKHVKYFRQIPTNADIYEFYVEHQFNMFHFDLLVLYNRMDREAYRVNKMDGCSFLKNPSSNRIFNNFYQSILVNKTAFKCPIKAGRYYLQPKITATVIPSVHPKGNFSFKVLIKQGTQSNEDAVLDLNWKYRVMKVK